MPRINYTVEQLREKAVDVRRDVVAMAARDQRGVGSALAAADLMTALFFYEINFDRENLTWTDRDVWHVSSSELAPAMYAAMAEVGLFPTADLAATSLERHVQNFPSHGSPGVEVSGGVPGAGLSVAVGVALASQMNDVHRRVYCIVDDAEIQAGQFWEAVMAAAHYELDNLVLVIDYDGRQADGDIEEVMGLAPLAEKLRAFNWRTLETDGNDLQQVVDAFDRSRSLKGAPVAILSCTAFGRGVSVLEDDETGGGGSLSEEQTGAAMAELGTTLEQWVKRLSA